MGDSTRRDAIVRWLRTALEQLSLEDAIAVADDVELRIVLARDQAIAEADLAIPVDPAPPYVPIDPRDVIGDGVRILQLRDSAYVIQRGPVREVKIEELDDQPSETEYAELAIGGQP
jgi:hypothetical protein